MSELERALTQRDEQLEQAKQFLNEAAFLAKYHQPALARHIRAFLNGIEC